MAPQVISSVADPTGRTSVGERRTTAVELGDAGGFAHLDLCADSCNRSGGFPLADVGRRLSDNHIGLAPWRITGRERAGRFHVGRLKRVRF